MSYLPPRVINDTLLPTANNPYKDLKVTCSLLVEQWRRFYPVIKYKMIKVDLQEAVNDAVGRVPYTKVDDLYGESVPDSSILSNDWHQPHAQDPEGEELDATQHTKYEDAIDVNIRVEVVSDEKVIGTVSTINDERDLVLYIPTSLLDLVGITISAGDVFEWDGDNYEVVAHNFEQRWKNTNYYLFIRFYAKRQEIGS